MSIREILAGGGGVKSIQTGYVNATTLASGAGEDNRYIDVTIAAVSSVSKCDVEFAGSGGTDVIYSGSYFSGSTSQASAIVTARLTSATNMRLATKSVNSTNMAVISGRWTVVEYK